MDFSYQSANSQMFRRQGFSPLVNFEPGIESHRLINGRDLIECQHSAGSEVKVKLTATFLRWPAISSPRIQLCYKMSTALFKVGRESGTLSVGWRRVLEGCTNNLPATLVTSRACAAQFSELSFLSPGVALDACSLL